MRKLLSVLAATLLAGCATVADAGALADVAVINRTTGERLQVYRHGGRLYVEGRAGERYAVELRNRTGGRILTVLSVDGVNAITGQTAAWDQPGYVLGPGERAEIRGWRKTEQRVAAFEFTALTDSYAVRTGRPEHVGVIGVALFREAPPLALSQVAPGAAATRDEPAPPAAQAEGRADTAARAAGRIGTGHGRSETSYVQSTRFERAQPNPDQVLAIRYDSRANLVAMGVIPSPPAWRPEPFPGSLGFVPDPPRP